MELVNQGINPLLFRGLKTTITSDESRQINFDTKPKSYPVCIRYVRSRTDPASFEAQSVASGMHDLFCGISGSRNAWKKTD